MLFSSLLFLLAAEPSIHLERLPITVNRPVDARFAPHTDKYLYICEHFGKVRVVVNGLLRFEPFLDIDYLTTDQVEQAGLLSIAFSPDFKRDKTFWVCYIDNNLDQVIARYTAKKFTKAKRKGDIIFTSSVLVKRSQRPFYNRLKSSSGRLRSDGCSKKRLVSESKPANYSG